MTQPAVFDRVWTVPNALSAARLLGVPLFIWLVLGPHADVWAVVVLAASGVSDYLDGRIARRFGLASRLGELLDPAADRLYILSTLVVLSIRSIIPVWLLVVLIGRDVVLAATLPILRRYGRGPLPVHFLGKAATLNLLYAFPLLLLSVDQSTAAHVLRPFAWAFTSWGTALYVWTGWIYLRQVSAVVRSRRDPGGSLPLASDPLRR